MKTIIEVITPENISIDACIASLRADVSFKILPRPTDEEIVKWSESTTMNAAAAQHRITAAEWMRSRIFEEDTP